MIFSLTLSNRLIVNIGTLYFVQYYITISYIYTNYLSIFEVIDIDIDLPLTYY